jgi:exonuclease SbcD
MKIFHTGDWHIGKLVNQVYMTEDQAYVLDRLVELIATEQPDVLIIAGDVYDRAIPPVEAIELLDRTLSRIVLDLKTPVLMVAGNHDSPDRLGFGSGILEARGLHIEGRLRPQVRRVTLRDAHGPVHFYLAPFAHPAEVRDVLGSEDIRDQNAAMQAILGQIQADWNPAQRNVLVTHGFVRGLEEPELCESEKPLSYGEALGGIEYVDAAMFADFDYVALGHLHGPQRAGSEQVRYSGSLLKYSFSEVNQNKSLTVVTLGPKGEWQAELRPLQPLRDMRRIKGELAQLLDPLVYQAANREDYLHVTLTDSGELWEPANQLRAVYPNFMSLELAGRDNTSASVKNVATEGYKTKSKLEQFGEFYTAISGNEFDEPRRSLLQQVLQEIEHSERSA